jgi:hypothetical protein
MRSLLLLCALAAPALADPGTDLPLHLGIDGGFSSLPGGSTLGQVALEAAWRPMPHLAVGGAMGGEDVELPTGSRGAFDLRLDGEGYQFVGRHLQLFARGGMGFQARGGARMPDAGASAVFAGVGARMFFDCPRERMGCWSLGYEVRAQHDLDPWLMFGGVLPAGSTVISSHVALGWEL